LHPEIEVPNFHISGWYDHCNGCLDHFTGMVRNGRTSLARENQKLIIGPWGHSTLGQQKVGEIDFGAAARLNIPALMVRWFDYWLKGIDNGIADEPPVKYFVMGANYWRCSDTWPPAPKGTLSLYLTSGGHANTPRGDGKLLRTAPKNQSRDEYTYDPRDPVMTLYGHPLFTIPADQRPLASRRDILVYQTAPLKKDVEIAGYPEVVLYASSSAPDTDFFGQWVDIDGEYAVVGTDHEQNGAYVYHREGTNWVMAGMVEDVHPRTGPGVGFYGDSGCLHGEYLFVGGDSYAILFQRNGTGWVKQIRVGNSDWDVSGTSVAVDPDWLVAGCPSDDSLLGNAGSLHVVSLNDRNRQSELIPTNTVQIRYIGSGLAVDGDMVLVGGRYGGSNDFGYVGVFAYNGTWWPVFQELIPSDATNSQQFGAAVDLCGQYALVGAPGDDELGEDSGAAYVFTLLFTGPGSNWVEQAKLLDTNLGANASLGAAVGTDGDYALVGAPDAGRGVVDIFSRSGTNWTLATTLTGTASSARFGRALDYDGTRVIIGSPNETVGTNMGAGTAYIYRRDGASWTLESPAPITSTNPSELGEFGASVGIDRDWCVVGEPHYGLQIGDQFGAVHIFRRVASTWVPWQTLYSPQPQGTGYYGCAVAIAWPYIMVGAPGEGWGYIYRLSADTNWVLLARIDGGDAEPGSNFGTTAALSEKYGLMGIAQEYSPKAYLFYAESFDLPPEITGIAMSNGTCVLEIDRLVPGFYTGVERADGALDGTWTRLEDFMTTCEKTNRNETPGSSGTAFFRALRW
ncbi:MAG: hypothetical protein DRP22_02995, partial [Verrucomicrobia bacterium]